MLRAASCLVLLLLVTAVAGQVASDTGTDVRLTARDSKAVVMSPGSAPKTMVFLVDSTSNGMFSIFSTQPQPTIALIDPNGTQIDGSNADALGFSYQKVPGGSLFLPDESDPVPGATTLIVLPATAALGTYQLVVDGSQLTADSVISASYTSSFSIRAGVVSDASTYHLGNSVLLSALLFDGPTPITGASITATISDPAQPTAQAAEISVPDSGDCDDATGDGIYNHPSSRS